MDRHLHRGVLASVPLTHPWVLLMTAALVVVAAAGPELAADRLPLTAQMVGHLALLQIAPLLLTVASTGRVDKWLRPLPRHALFGWTAGLAAMTLWHVPTLFLWMMSSPAHRVIADVSLVMAGLLFWRPLFAESRSRRLSAGHGIAYLFTACLGSTIAGVSIALSPPGLYGVHASSAADQQLAGLVMWVPCCVVYVAVVVTILVRWYGGADDRRTVAAPEA